MLREEERNKDNVYKYFSSNIYYTYYHNLFISVILANFVFNIIINIIRYAITLWSVLKRYLKYQRIFE